MGSDDTPADSLRGDLRTKEHRLERYRRARPGQESLLRSYLVDSRACYVLEMVSKSVLVSVLGCSDRVRGRGPPSFTECNPGCVLQSSDILVMVGW